MTFRGRQQQGLTLVELMIAMVLGVFLIGGLIQVFMSGRASYRVQEGLGRVQESARFADFYLGRVLRNAGRPRVFGATNLTPGGFFMPVDNRVDDSGLPATRDGENGGPDVITVMYRSDTNCLGNDTTYGAQTITDYTGARYAKDQFMLDGGDPPSLVCRGLGANGLPVAGHTQPLVGGVDDFQVLYGIDRDGDGLANSYENATNVQPTEWLSIVSLRYAVLVSSETAVKSTDDALPFALLDGPLRGPYTDGRMRQVVESTIDLRNRSQ